VSDRTRLLALLRELSYQQRRVVLASGRESDFYIDCRNTALHPEGITLCGRVLMHALLASGPEFSAVAGPSIGADPLVSGIAFASHLAGTPIPALMVRKEAKGHGTGRRLEGTFNVSPGCKIAVVEDVLTTGGSALRTVEAIRAAGYEPVRVIALVDREEGGLERVAETGLPVEALFGRTEIVGPVSL
jgi:orotate phosphoribosyltransferase